MTSLVVMGEGLGFGIQGLASGLTHILDLGFSRWRFRVQA